MEMTIRVKANEIPSWWLDKKRFGWGRQRAFLGKFYMFIQWWIFQWAELLSFLLTHSDRKPTAMNVSIHCGPGVCVCVLGKLPEMSKNTNYPIRLFAIMPSFIRFSCFDDLAKRVRAKTINMSYKFQDVAWTRQIEWIKAKFISSFVARWMWHIR